jgi:hypothetical protein
MKAISLILIVATLVGSAEAGIRTIRPGQRKRDKAEERREQKERAARERKHEAIQKLLDQKDRNHDGSLSRDEYLIGEANTEAAGKKFDTFNKNSDRVLSKSEIEELLGL